MTVQNSGDVVMMPIKQHHKKEIRNATHTVEVVREGGGTAIFLDGFEIQGLVDYKIKDRTNFLPRITITLRTNSISTRYELEEEDSA